MQVLIDKGYAYEASGDVYFRVENKGLCPLANKTLSDLEAGASGRVDGEGQLKEHPFDFALWKSAKPGEVSWKVRGVTGVQDGISMFGYGNRQIGRHHRYSWWWSRLGLPHHTNQIAQSECKTGQTLANYWMHNAMLNINDEKMSKSLGNFLTAH